MNEDQILTIPEVASELRCSKAHVYNLIRGRVKGVSALRAIQMGRRVIVRRGSLSQWKRENETAAGDMLPVSLEVDAVDADGR